MLEDTISHKSGSSILLKLAAFIIIVAGIKAAKVILVPFLFAAFLALICAPPIFWLEHKGFRSWAALLIIILLVVSIGSILGIFFGRSLNSFTTALPSYQQQLEIQTQSALSWIGSWGIAIPTTTLKGVLNPGKVMQMAGHLLSGLSGLLANGFLITLTALLILLEASSFRTKLGAAFGNSNLAFCHFDEIAANINHYLAIKTAVSVTTGIAVACWTTMISHYSGVYWRFS